MLDVARIATHLDRLGMRRLVAKVSGLAYHDRTFAVDARGRWVNKQHDCVIVSPDINTMPFAAVRAIAERNWCHQYTPRRGDIVVDVGAGIGDEIVAFSKMVGDTGRVIAIEAAPGTFACLQETVQRSGLNNVTCLNVAVDEREGFATIEDGDAHLANSIRGKSGARVRATSLDILFQDLALDRVDLLKMNIEGAEKMAVRGLNEHVAKVRHVAISCHDFIAPEDEHSFFRTKVAVTADLRDRGFDVAGRDAVEGEPWVGDYVYGTRKPTSL